MPDPRDRSAVSIPSRRVGNLQAGMTVSVCVGFNPLKAGRKQIPTKLAEIAIDVVSIPSRRVGNEYMQQHESLIELVSIPSRRVGNLLQQHNLEPIKAVSIPSRRVGNRAVRT